MRRFAALFKRNDKPDVTPVSPTSNDPRPNLASKSTSFKKRSRLFRTFSVKAVQPAVVRDPPPSVPQPPPQASSSSSSSTDSPVPATPDDISEIGLSASRRGSNQWLERKLSTPLVGGSLGWDSPNSLPPSIPPIPAIAGSSGSEEVDDDTSMTSSSLSVSSPLPVTPHTSLHSLTTYALSPTISAPPLLHLPNVPLFPRSTNFISSLPHQETMGSTLHRTQILRRLARRDLTASEERSVATFTSRRILPTKSQFLLSKFDDGPACNIKRVSNISQGLKRWVSRPCFEDRVSVYTLGPSGRSDDIIVHSVSGGTLGVAALEISQAIELLAGSNLEEQSATFWLPTLPSSSTADLRLPVSAPTTASAAQTKNQPYKATPSPLRTEATPPPPDHKPALKPIRPSLRSSLSLASPSLTSPTNVTTRTKRARSTVRFDVGEKEDKDDNVPLGQIIRIKRGREERAKFLELEKERRALEEERSKHEVEKRQWEQEKRAWEAEKKAAEEEKKKRLYQQEVIAARKRRESQMSRVASSPTDLPETESQSSRRQGSYSRPAYDPSRREGSDASLPALPHPPPRNDSFNSLRGTSRPQSLHSAPPSSLHTVPSLDDVAKIRARRTSMLPDTPPQLPVLPQPYGYPWGMPVMPMQVPMVPQMPYYAMDSMPLLPPTPPFMMQQTSDRRRSASSSPNRSSTSLGKSVTQSTDGLSPSQGPTRPPAKHQRSSSGGSSNQLENGQRSNQDSANSSRRSSGIVNDPNQWRNSMRSRPAMPQSSPQGTGSWVVPSPGSQRRQNTVS